MTRCLYVNHLAWRHIHARRTLARRAGTRTAVLAALTLAGTTLSGVSAVAAPIPGDNGDVKIHASTTAAANQRNDPKVCDFYLAAFSFDAGEKVNWTIQTQPEVRAGPRAPAPSPPTRPARAVPGPSTCPTGSTS